MATRILLVDDHQMFRQGLDLMFGEQPDMKVIGDQPSAELAWPLIEKLHPDIVIADIELPGISGIELAKRMRVDHPEIRVIMLTAHGETSFVDEAMRAGVAGYLLKLRPATELITAVQLVRKGQVHLSPEVSAVLVREYQRRCDQTAPTLLSEREREILKRIADGQSTKEIAFALRLSAKTIDTHRLKIMSKLGIRSVAEMIKYAIREGITTLN